MSKLLYIESSPRKDRSASIEVAQSFISTFQNMGTDNEVKTLDLWDEVLPEFDGNRINAKYRVMHGENPTQEEALAWEEISKIVTQFKAADHYLFSLPMWNFSIPYKLKHYIDLISQPGLTWSFSPDTGYQGLVTGKSATLILARGGEYSSSAEAGAMDFQKSYMEMVLGFMGFQDINTVLVEPTLTDPESKGKTLAAMKEKASSIAKQL
ncbi:MAG: NAD(P)H-dependent oxidoreductase [Porticoccus sp.]